MYGQTSRIGVLKRIYTSYLYWLETVVAFVAYYAFYMVLISRERLIFEAAPMYIIYLLIASSAVLLTIATYSIRRQFNVSKSAAAGGWSVFASAAGTALISCGCESPIIAPMLYLIGLNALEVSSLISYIASYQTYLLSFLFLLNLLFIYYSLGSAAGMRHTKGKVKMSVDIK